jgi:hypothetical protein
MSAVDRIKARLFANPNPHSRSTSAGKVRFEVARLVDEFGRDATERAACSSRLDGPGPNSAD